MRVIHKQEINYRDASQQTLSLPIHSKVISCDFQGESLVIWYMFDPLYEHTMSGRSFWIVRTGETTGEFIDSGKARFIGTANDRDKKQPFVIHLFELIF